MMKNYMTTRTRLRDTVLNVGPPLMAIAALSIQHQVPVGTLCTVWAAVMAGAVVPLFSRFIGDPFLKVCGVEPNSVTEAVFLGACSASIGATSALLFLPQ